MRLKEITHNKRPKQSETKSNLVTKIHVMILQEKKEFRTKSHEEPLGAD